MPAQVEARRAPVVEQRDLRRVAQSEQRAVQGDSVVDRQRADLGLGDRRRELVMRHRSVSSPYSTPSAVSSDARPPRRNGTACSRPPDSS